MDRQPNQYIFWMRHGDCNQISGEGSEDKLNARGWKNIAEHAALYLRATVGSQEITPKQTSLTVSKKQRNTDTGQAVIVTAFNLPMEYRAEGRTFPQTRRDLKQIDWDNELFYTRIDEGLTYPADNLNMDIYGNNPDDSINFGLQNPDATMHDGQPVERGSAMRHRIASTFHRTANSLFANPNHRLAIVVGHAPYQVIPVFDSIKNLDPDGVNCVEDVGGHFKMGEAALFTFKHRPDLGGRYDLHLSRPSQDFTLDRQISFSSI
tara:strand:- start:3619 stop:4410 length:792 start_codon:yes stop_codon:yes gene_type:complete